MFVCVCHASEGEIIVASREPPVRCRALQNLGFESDTACPSLCAEHIEYTLFPTNVWRIKSQFRELL